MPNWRNLGWVGKGPGASTPAPAPVPAQAEAVENDADPFPCSKCDKGFTSQRGLSRHATAVHVDRGGDPLD